MRSKRGMPLPYPTLPTHEIASLRPGAPLRLWAHTPVVSLMWCRGAVVVSQMLEHRKRVYRSKHIEHVLWTDAALRALHGLGHSLAHSLTPSHAHSPHVHAPNFRAHQQRPHNVEETGCHSVMPSEVIEDVIYEDDAYDPHLKPAPAALPMWSSRRRTSSRSNESSIPSRSSILRRLSKQPESRRSSDTAVLAEPTPEQAADLRCESVSIRPPSHDETLPASLMKRAQGPRGAPGMVRVPRGTGRVHGRAW